MSPQTIEELYNILIVKIDKILELLENLSPAGWNDGVNNHINIALGATVDSIKKYSSALQSESVNTINTNTNAALAEHADGIKFHTNISNYVHNRSGHTGMRFP